MVETQMTAVAIPTGASPTKWFAWDDINWSKVEKHVRKLQVCIAKATLKWVVGSGFLAYERLEPCAVKVARTVLRGRDRGDAILLPDGCCFSGKVIMP